MKSFIDLAIEQAKKAFKKNEVPIGAVIVKNNKVISCGYNNREKSQIATNHAEIIAINKACKKLHSWRLDDCDLYVTLEPCPMCAGAILNARIKNVYVGAKNTNNNKNLCQEILNNSLLLNHKTNLFFLENEECKTLLSNFFKSKR